MSRGRNLRRRAPLPTVEALVATVDRAFADAQIEHRRAIRFCTYPSGEAELGQIRGPNVLGEYLISVSSELVEGGVRVGWAYAIEADFDRLGMRKPRPLPKLPRLSGLPSIALRRAS